MDAINGWFPKNSDEMGQANTMRSQRVTVLLLSFLLAACTGQFATLVPSSTTPFPIATVIPSATPMLPTPETALPANVPAATINAVATVDAIRIDILGRFPELQDYDTFCSPGYCYGVQGSPDGHWIYLTNFNTMDVFSAAGERVGKCSFYDIYGYKINYAEGLVDGAHWSKDGQYLYISASLGGDGGPEPYFGYTKALVRLNLEDGIWNPTQVSGSFAFSPHDEYVIYSNHKSQI